MAGRAARVRTRNAKDWTEGFPSISAALENLKAEDAVLDMEAVIVDAEGKSSFQAMQAALGEGGNSANIVAYVFDVLHLDGEDLTGLPLTRRKEKLRALLKKSKQHTALRFSEHIVGQGTDRFAKACVAGLEGIIQKGGRALHGGATEKLAEDQMRTTAGIYYSGASVLRVQANGH